MKVAIVLWVLGRALFVKADTACTDQGGYCHTGSCGGFWKSGLCYGPAERRCCIDTAGDSECTSAGGNCQTTTCSGVFQSGLCAGPVDRRCCLQDSACIDAGGTCQTTACSGTSMTGLCSGPTDRRCCVQNNGEDKLSHSEAASMLSDTGISISSSGGCSDRYDGTCTSLEQIRRATITGTINEIKIPSGCSVTVTGGTETGHSSGTYSHWNGYKIDLRLNSCLDSYITTTFPFNRWRGSDAVYRSPSGNDYVKEGNHWDNTYY
ncbi:unnamed protein product [Owenia fusiformis]|uniref:Uncharacterized protein n=1 Tax=Owenia fusiformis TaxID=6347 RepID=A0A8J1XKK8_OWEFU|nr:unnamed protein product [Owenia fusiformis]